MLRAIFVRTLKPGKTIEDYLDAWVPDDADKLEGVRTSISQSTTNERQILTIIEVDASTEEYGDIAPKLVKPDAWDRLAEVVESTELETVFAETDSPSRFGQAGQQA
ncbi:MAG: hypothetical protein JWQ43_3697 [Glaciihabitans sp.]|nr:hypothetical protein [Glaciihabitans sp.]